MRKGIVVEVSAADRACLEAVVADRNSPQKHVWRARIVLLTAAGHGTVEIMRQAGVSKVAVWRWQERFMVAGVEGLLRDKTRPSRIPPLGERGHGPGADADHDRRSAGRDDALDRHRHGAAGGHQRQLGATDLARARAAAASGQGVQALQRPGRRRRLQPPRSCAPSSGCTSTRRPTPSCSRSTRNRMCGWPPARKGLVERFLRQAACNHVSGLIRGRHGPQALMGSADWDLNKSSGLRPSTFPGFPRSVGATDHAIALLSSQASAWRLRPTPQPRPGRLSAAP